MKKLMITGGLMGFSSGVWSGLLQHGSAALWVASLTALGAWWLLDRPTLTAQPILSKP